MFWKKAKILEVKFLQYTSLCIIFSSIKWSMKKKINDKKIKVKNFIYIENLVYITLILINYIENVQYYWKITITDWLKKFQITLIKKY